MSVLDTFAKKRAFVVCVDSDGCAMDTMNIKHFRCFGPCMVEEWGLQEWREDILKRWNEINLFTATRGINRFKGLALALREIHEKYKPIEGIEALEEWAENAPELSNDAAERMIPRNAVFAKALSWSRAVNRAIGELPQEESHPFAFVREALQEAHAEADVVIVSSANPEAVREEWVRHGLMDEVDLICTQEIGSKAYCIGKLAEKGYAPDHILMCGDAPGDEKAASSNGVLFFPILVGKEAESWQEFRRNALALFIGEAYAGTYQADRIAEFHENLKIE